MAVELATGYISIVPETKDFERKLKASFKNSGRNLELVPSVDTKGVSRSLSRAGSGSADGFVKNFRAKASAGLDDAGKKMGKALGGGIAAGAAVAVGGLGYVLTKGFGRLKKIDDATFKLSALGHSAESVQVIMKSAESSVKGTAFALDEAASAAASAVAAGVKPGQDLTKYLSTVADTAAIAGVSFEEMASIFNGVQTSNKAFSDDLGMLADRGIPIMQYLSQQFGVTAEELDGMVQDGKISAADFAKALESNLGGAAQKMGQSFSGAVANAEAALGRLGAALLKPIFGQAGGGFTGATAEIDKLTALIKNNGDTVIGFFGEMGKAAVGFAQGCLAAFAAVTQGFGWIVNAAGDTVGGLTKAVAGANRLLGRDEIADQLDKDAESMFGWGDDILDTAKKSWDLVYSLDDVITSIDKTKVRMQDAARLTRAFGDAIVKVDGEQIIISDNSPKINENLDALGIRLENLPDGRVTLVPNTPEAQQQIDAFLGKNNPTPPMVAPLDADTTPAQAKLNAFLEQWKTSMTSLPTPGNSGGNPLTDPLGINGGTPTNPLTAPLVGTGTQGGMGGAGPLPIRAGGGQSLGAATSGKQFFGSAMSGDAMPPAAQRAVDFAIANAKGQEYSYGSAGANGRYDCSGIASAIYSAATGKNVRFTTESDFAALGFLPGSAPGALNIGVKRGGGGPNSHMALTLPNGVNVESGGAHGTTAYGGPAAGAGSFPMQWHLPLDKYATGGHVNGPGGVDNVPAWLTAGEHVLTTEDVKAMGGQAGVYAFRNMLASGASPLGLVQTDTDPKPGKKGPQYGGTPDRKPGNNPNQIAIPDWSKPGTGWGDPPEDWWLKPINPDDVLFPEFWGQNPWGPHPLEKGRFGFLNNMLADGGEVQLFDKGGWWKSGTLGMNKTGKDEYVLTPERIAELEKRDAQKGNTPHGAAQGAPPGPSPEELAKLEQPEINDAGRQEGYIPSGAGYSGATGGGLAGSLIGMGAEAVNGLIDQAAGAASMGADVFAPGSSVAIQMGAAIAKRGVQYAAEMGSIGIGALSEILLPFGAPRWLSDVDATSFMPQQAMTAATTTTSEQAVEDINNQHGLNQGAAPGPIPPQGPQPPAGLDMLSKATQESADALAPPPLPPLVNVEKIEAADSGAVGESIAKGQRLAMMRFAGRP